MAERRRIVERRVRHFIGCESDSEAAFLVWLQRLSDELGLHVHLDRAPANGGDTLSIVRECVKFRNKGLLRGRYESSFVLLDHDRFEADGNRARQAVGLAQDEGIILVFARPKFEGLLLRLYPGRENDFPPPNEVDRRLLQVWPSYRKPPIARDLISRFEILDLIRVSRYDAGLRHLLQVIGIIPTPRD